MAKKTDICLILEGTYPYVSGGVSSWTHDLINSLSEYTFSLVCIQPQGAELIQRYQLPANVKEVRVIHLQQMDKGRRPEKEAIEFFRHLKPYLVNIQTGNAELRDLEGILELLDSEGNPGYEELLLNSDAAWEILTEMYNESQPESSFIDFFWSWRALLGGMLSVLLADLPNSRAYHSISTGFAGLLVARASLEKQRPAMLTEHGIYTNERRIEINAADWLLDFAPTNLTVENPYKDLRTLWMDSFASYARICYQSCSKVITLFNGNQEAQLEGGATPEKMQVIPNGIDVARFSSLPRESSSHPTLALIGRVVPIKDVKTYIRSVAMIRKEIPNIQAYVIGPYEEDVEYYEECRQLAKHLGLDGTLTFTGMAKIEDYLPIIDVIVFTSISEAQPLVILEAGAAGIPTVATDVGACSELILGRADETPALGAGGVITSLANPAETARAVTQLLTDRKFYAAACKVIKKRVETYYSKEGQQNSYRAAYQEVLDEPVSEKTASFRARLVA